MADVLGARAAEIIFTGSGTEADNLALKGVARAMRAHGNHLITTAIEHHAVLESCHALEREGFRITYLSPSAEGLITPEQVHDAITPATILVSVMYANNEVGTIQPIADIGRLCRTLGIPFHTDAVQAVGECNLRVEDLAVDLLTLSAHKFYGPKGIGVLYVRQGTRLQPMISGGGQEQERRAGTEDVAGIVGCATALALAYNAEDVAQMRVRRDRLIDGLLAIPASRLHGSHLHRLANNVNVGFAGVAGETLQQALDLDGIAISTGSACTSGAVEASHVLQAMGSPPATAAEAIRFSLGRPTTDEEITRVIAVLQNLVPRLRRR